MSAMHHSAPAQIDDGGGHLPEVLIGAELAGADLSGRDLSGRDLSRSNLRGAHLSTANLKGTVLFEADLEGAQLLGADLSGANLSNANLVSAQLGGAVLTRANLFEADASDATLSRVDARHADFRKAHFRGARILDADLRSANLSGAQFDHADLTGSRVTNTSFRDADLRETVVRGLDGYTQADWVGCSIGHIDFTGAYLLRRAIVDQNYLHEFRSQSRKHALLYILWSATSDCGRSFVRWGLLSVVLAGVFSFLYALGGIDFGPDQTLLSPLYFSVVTITTLGYGDVLPVSGWGQVAVMVEVVVGYMMLGGLMSIVSNKMGRRGD
ncbi:MAG: hypothetical protein GY698_01165 [Actinomycetia bacterium]|nr:hypothetical protein [Actinomycetes bacterium]